ncbi:MAG: hypothetical protein LW817_02970 [Candidatus Caenarcaniphilales bacterium]|jgi:cell division protein YceG involved in septum cleavage|nr:hypothetical protein [Candidatus Caenarcaniphilales bacterium]
MAVSKPSFSAGALSSNVSATAVKTTINKLQLGSSQSNKKSSNNSEETSTFAKADSKSAPGNASNNTINFWDTKIGRAISDYANGKWKNFSEGILSPEQMGFTGKNEMSEMMQQMAAWKDKGAKSEESESEDKPSKDKKDRGTAKLPPAQTTPNSNV